MVFCIFGKSDLVILVEMVFAEVFSTKCVLHRMTEIPSEPMNGILLIGEENLPNILNGHRYVNLVKELAKMAVYT